MGSSSSVDIVDIDRSAIAWQTDRDLRFRNPNGDFNVSVDDIAGTVRPPNWPRNISEIDGGLANESLIVWFRVSAFPLFRKLYGRVVIDDGQPGQTELPAGTYALNITYSILFQVSLSLSLSSMQSLFLFSLTNYLSDYPVSAFNGQKSIILAEVSALGGRNLFLGISYIVVGSFLIIAAVVLLIVHLFFSKW